MGSSSQSIWKFPEGVREKYSHIAWVKGRYWREDSLESVGIGTYYVCSSTWPALECPLQGLITRSRTCTVSPRPHSPLRRSQETVYFPESLGPGIILLFGVKRWRLLFALAVASLQVEVARGLVGTCKSDDGRRSWLKKRYVGW